MGLDICIYRVKKPAPFENRVFGREELLDQGYCLVAQANDYGELIQDLLPYTREVLVKTAYLNMEAVQKDYGLSEQAYTCEWHDDGSLGLFDPNSDGGRHITLTPGEINKKYTVYVNEKTAVFVREKVAYWRKNYHVQGFFYDALDCVENTGYYLLSEEVLTKFNAEAYENGWDMLPVEAPTEDSALFYWEWY